MEKKQFQPVEIEVITIAAEDVICTSGTVSVLSASYKGDDEIWVTD